MRQYKGGERKRKREREAGEEKKGKEKLETGLATGTAGGWNVG